VHYLLLARGGAGAHRRALALAASRVAAAPPLQLLSAPRSAWPRRCCAAALGPFRSTSCSRATVLLRWASHSGRGSSSSAQTTW